MLCQPPSYCFFCQYLVLVFVDYHRQALIHRNPQPKEVPMPCFRCNTQHEPSPFIGFQSTSKARELCRDCFYRFEYHNIQRRVGIFKAREIVKRCLAGDHKKAWASSWLCFFSCPYLVVCFILVKLAIPAITPHSRKNIDFTILRPEDQDSPGITLICSSSLK